MSRVAALKRKPSGYTGPGWYEGIDKYGNRSTWVTHEDMLFSPTWSLEHRHRVIDLNRLPDHGAGQWFGTLYRNIVSRAELDRLYDYKATLRGLPVSEEISEIVEGQHLIERELFSLNSLAFITSWLDAVLTMEPATANGNDERRKQAIREASLIK